MEIVIIYNLERLRNETNSLFCYILTFFLTTYTLFVIEITLGITFIRILDSKMLRNYGYIKNIPRLNFGPLRTRNKEIRLQNCYVFFKIKKVVKKSSKLQTKHRLNYNK